ncbi:hypothetical protein DRJ22_02305, partial [Candidatus Woesearchaeota archaeon]
MNFIFLFNKNNFFKLLSKSLFFMDVENWEEKLAVLRSGVVPASKDDFKNALISAVAKLVPDERFGVLLSGGIDSSLIAFLCKQRTDNFVCYSVGLEGSPDLAAAEFVADHFSLKLKTRVISSDEVPSLIKDVVSVLRSPDVVDLGVGCVCLAAGRLAEADGVRFVFSGLGSDELLAGYSSFLKTDDVQQEAWRRIFGVVKDVKRDVALAGALGLDVLFPFLDFDVIKTAMGLPPDLKLKAEHKKFVLRLIAEDFSFPEEIVWRRKKAAQYGSGFDRIISGLAKQNG